MFQAPRGTLDILPDEQQYQSLFQEKAGEIATRFGYERIDTPVFEDTRLFVRGIGEVTDIVEKEMYTFEDRGGDLLTLRPEGTAPVCRAYLEHGLHNLPQPVRMYYIGPFFRYDRPQAGRYRQLHQFGIEAIGDGDACVDVEVIEVAWRFLESLGLSDLSLGINSIGDANCRPGYVRQLQEYYRGHVDEICSDCKVRLDRNPLRLLDCKQESCQPIIAGAPPSAERLCRDCEEHWGNLLTNLAEIGINYEIDNRLVRGFDYYSRTVFEITPPVEGRQSTLVGGGRYDGLIEQLGGRPTPGVGFGMGVERVIATVKQQQAPVPTNQDVKVLAAYLGDAARLEAMKMGSRLRKAGTAAVLGPSGRSLRSQLRYASSIKATHALIIGDDEIQKEVFTLRDLVKGQQQEVTGERLFELLGKAT